MLLRGKRLLGAFRTILGDFIVLFFFTMVFAAITLKGLLIMCAEFVSD